MGTPLVHCKRVRQSLPVPPLIRSKPTVPSENGHSQPSSIQQQPPPRIEEPHSSPESNPTFKMSSVDWAAINEKLPFERTDEAKEKRRELFKQFDPNGNGYLSLAETDKGVRDVLGSDELFDCKPAINRAFHFAKDKSTGDDKHGPDFLEFFQAFDTIDTGDDRRVSKEEFTSEAIKPVIEKWVSGIEDWDAEFDSIDKNGGGQILFAEFVDW